MACLAACDSRDFSHYVFVLGDNDAPVDAAKDMDSSVCHLPCGLACGNKYDSAAAPPEILQSAAYGFIRKHRVDTRLYDCIGVCS